MQYLMIPPVRRNGPRESTKANVTDAEMRYMIAELTVAADAAQAALHTADDAAHAAVAATATAIVGAAADATRL